ncbi:hypothetical protein DBR06_SOUSAS17710031, partial [Sousa chinensis]
ITILILYNSSSAIEVFH